MKLVIVAAILALASGCEVDCQDGGALEASFKDGQRAAAAQTAADFDRGHRDGLALTKADGEHDGKADGYRDGYADAYDAAYSDGYSEGYANGGNDGAADPTACTAGATRSTNVEEPGVAPNRIVVREAKVVGDVVRSSSTS